MRTKTNISGRARFLTGVATTLLIAGLAAPAYAQTADAVPEQETPQEGEAIVVTGSRIATSALTAANPISQVSSEEFLLSSSATAENLLNTLPQVVPGESGFTNNESSGVATVNLRGLGEQRNLVLVNGRRYIFFDARQVTDLNTVPTGLVDRVELVTGGSSAVYGSDAVSGVVNFILKKDFEGLELTGQYDITAAGDAGKMNFDGIVGGNFADDRGNATVYFNYFKRDPLKADARDRSACFLEDTVINGVPSLQCGGSAGIPNGRFAGLPLGAQLAARPQVVSALAALGLSNVDANGFKFDDTGTQVSPFVAPGDRYNFNPDNYLQLPQERRIIGAMANYKVSEGIEAYFEGIYTNNIVDTQFAATPVSGSYRLQVNSPFLTAGMQNLLRALDETETTAATRNDGFTTLSVGRRIEEGGVRTSTFERNAWRVVGGLRGDLGSVSDSFLKNLKYDAYYSYARTRNVTNSEGVILSAAFAQGVTTVFRNPTTGATSPFPFAGVAGGGTLVCENSANGCVPLNIFGPNISPEGIAFITGRTTSSEEAEMQVATGVVTGTLFDLPAGPLGFAAGVEWRDVSAFFIPSQGGIGDVGVVSGGGYNVKEIFGEVRVPVIDGLELNGAFRYSDYSLGNIGGVWTYGGGATYQVIPQLMLRAQYQRAVRAPSVDELYRSQSGLSEAATDPCALASAASDSTIRGLCIATGVPEAAIGSSGVQPSFQLRGVVGGNPDLTEETTDTYTLGAVFQPIRNMSVTLDYYNIAINDAIFRAPLQSVLDLCYNVFQDADSFYCKSVVRLPDGTIGNPGGINAPFDNIGSIKTDGIDASASYRFDVSRLIGGNSSFSVAGSLNWLNRFDRNPVAAISSLTIKCAGAFGLSCSEPLPTWKGTGRATLKYNNLSVSLRYRYIGAVTDDRVTRGINTEAQLAVPVIHPEHYFDLSMNWDVKPFSVFGGVVNMFDNHQQLLGSSQEQLNTFPSTYDPLGIRFFAGIKLKL
ncbi:TonB-dependent receptor [Sphingomonas sp. dw_22]|uniref:TonB-dependent receptor domain-containing protein n=1 Tax=Sphingomonas sp. dw_22 TaxID=2721175 RepID=UPI001BD6ADA7|nr:TonB-dependent receptor [Sphingomonas sp. dw_22]